MRVWYEEKDRAGEVGRGSERRWMGARDVKGGKRVHGKKGGRRRSGHREMGWGWDGQGRAKRKGRRGAGETESENMPLTTKTPLHHRL